MSRKIYVTEAGYDDIGAILGSLGEGFKYQTLSWSSSIFNNLAPNDILFINCHSSCTDSPTRFGDKLRKFVSAGGILYASDWAGALVAETFGDYLEFNDDGQSETINAKVEDGGLREILGSQISLYFDLGGWWRITRIKKDVKILLKHQKTPLLVSFKVKQGYVLYTSFHNHSQVSGLEKNLLEYLVFRPLLSRVAGQASDQAISTNYKVDKEIISSTQNSQVKDINYPIDIDKPTTILSLLSWEGSAKFEMTLEHPQFGVAKKLTSDKSPIGIEFLAQQTGKWFVKINPLFTPYPNFPFALTLAKGGEKQQLTPNISSTPYSNQSGLKTGNATAANPISQMSPIKPIVAPAANPIKGNLGIANKHPSQILLAPVLFPILNMGGLSEYEVRWMPQAGQEGYLLQEACTSSFSDSKEVYNGNLTSFMCSKKLIGIYYYRICSYKGNEKSAWSDIQSTNVLHAS